MNCSHGCIRQTAANAIWFYSHAQPGDPVVVTGTDRPLAWDDGWGFYQMPWHDWLKGSALPAAQSVQDSPTPTPSPVAPSPGGSASPSPSTPRVSP
jgi:hypothetical protein